MAKSKTATQTSNAKKKDCPVTRAEFSQHAQPIVASIGDSKVVLDARQFSSGSMGWFAGERVTLTINGKPVRCQLGLNLTVIGSKELPPLEG